MSNDMKELFDRKSSSSEILNKKKNDTDVIDSWDKFFKDLFAKPLNEPKHTQILMRRSLPYGHPNNDTEDDLQIPYMFSFDDLYKERWLGYLFDTSETSTGFRFLLMKPDKEILLGYIKGEIPLMNVYDSSENLLVFAPNISDEPVIVNKEDLPDSAIPADNSMYNENIWFDVKDLNFGMNVAHSRLLIDLAKRGRFY